jgi:GNAT superfamily N-acetyltransferase
VGLDHSANTDHVWQLEVRREPRGPQVAVTFREVRLPRPVALMYPNLPSALADEWRSKALMLAALAGTEAIGYLALSDPRARVAWITDLVVAPRWRRRGAATALLEAAHRWSAERSHQVVFLEMQSKNHPAIMLAQKLGYEFCGYNDRYYSNQDITLFFVKLL